MAKNQRERPNEINLEDLLRVKRSERPSEQFWNEFDRELHQRMLQTLVKKDPWYLQLMRAFSGRLGQSIAIGAAAAVVAMVVVRPAFQPVKSSQVAVAEVPVAVEVADLPVVEVASSELTYAEALSLSAMADYDTDVISVEVAVADADFTRDFGMESMEMASYDAFAYSTDSANARASYASAGVASLVY